MNPLWYLQWRQFVNGIRRAFATPARAAMILVATGLLGMTFIGMFRGGILDAEKSMGAALSFPPMDAAVGILMAFHYILILGSITRSVLLFSDSDVNFLFPSPLNRFGVFRQLLLQRGMLVFAAFLVYGIFYGVVMGSKTFALLTATVTIKAAYGPLLYLAEVLAIAMSLLYTGTYIGFRAWRGRHVWGKFWTGYLLVVAPVVFWLVREGALAVRIGRPFLAGVLQGLNAPFIYWLLMPLRGPSECAMMIFTGWTPGVAFGFAFWFGLLIVSHELLRGKGPWLYEYAASTAQVRPQSRMGNRIDIEKLRTQLVEKIVRQGTAQKKRLPFLDRWTPSGAGAILWRDLLIFWRQNDSTLKTILVLLIILPLGMSRLPAGPKLEKYYLVGYLFAQVMLMVYFLANSQVSLHDSLKKIDIQRALPLPARTIILYETLPTFFSVLLFEMLLAVFSLYFAAAQWPVLLYCCCVVSSFLLPVNMGLIYFFLLNPDDSDPLQQLMRAFLIVPVFFLPLLPGGLLLGLFLLLKVPLLVNAVSVIAVNAAATFVLLLVVGRKYETFNPTN